MKLNLASYLIAALVAATLSNHSLAEDWGAYSIIPVSAPKMVLEAVGAGTADGTAVSINKPAGTPNQKWVITPKGDNLFSIKPSSSSTLALTIAKDGIVYLNMKGSCAGCPSSTATLQHGIQNLLKHFVPDVVEVRPM